MQTYRQIQNHLGYTELIWEIEQNHPNWYRTADALWTPDYESFLKFWLNCGEIWGLFDNDNLKVVVYFEYVTRIEVNVHISVIGDISGDLILKYFRSLLRHKKSEGVQIFTGWVAKKNRGLIKIAEQTDFYQTGLKMKYGYYNSQVLEWVEMQHSA
jgi:hypothetical protein